MPRKHRLFAATITLVFASAIATPTAQAFTSWSTPTSLTNGTSFAGDEQVAMSADGTRAVVIWREGTGMGEIHMAAATVAIDAAGNSVATWATPILVSNASYESASPDVALSANGSTVAASWVEQRPGSIRVVRTNVYSLTGSTLTGSTPVDISDSAVSANETTKVRLSSDGTRAIVAWEYYRVTEGTMVQTASATITGGSATWGATTTFVETGPPALLADLEFSGDGQTAAITYVTRAYDPDKDFRVLTATAAISGTTQTWSAPHDFGVVTGNDPRLALSSDGSTAAVVWKEDAGPILLATAHVSGATQTWEASNQTLSTMGDAPEVSLSADGGAVAATWYENYTTVNAAVGTVDASGNATMGSASTWASSGIAQIQLSGDGSKVVLLYGVANKVTSTTGQVSGTTATWGASSTLSGADVFIGRLAIASSGASAIASWHVNDVSGTVIVQAAVPFVSSSSSAKNFGKSDKTAESGSRSRGDVSGVPPGGKKK